jgi:hypothetical protein
MSSFPYKNPISSEQLNGVQSVQRSEVFGTNFSVLSVGGYMEVYNTSDLIYTINGLGPIEYSGNTIPIDFLKGTGDPWSPDVLTLNSDNISSGRRRLGMLVYVYENDQTYQFRIDNYETLWTAATASTGTVVISDFGTTVYNSSVAGQNFINAWTASTIEDISGATYSTAVWKKYNPGSGGTPSTSADTLYITGTGINSTIRKNVGNTASGNYGASLGGSGNTASGNYSFIGGGVSGTSLGYYGAIVGGVGNTISAKYSSSILGGVGNIIAENQSVIGGGVTNVIGSTSSTYSIYCTNSTYNRVVILNDVTSSYPIGNTVEFFNCVDNKFIRANITNSTYSGGYTCLDLDNSTASNVYGGVIINSTTISQSGTQNYSGIVGGLGNNITQSAYYSFIGGGFLNKVTSPNSVINGGSCNNISGKVGYSVIGGGRFNTASNSYSTVGGGRCNTASNYHSTVGGGFGNTASNYYSTVSGGRQNTASKSSSTVGGGRGNTSSGYYSTVSGGYGNTASGDRSTVSGGRSNTASCYVSFVGGGFGNTASCYYSTVGGGSSNTASGWMSTVGGGCKNTSSNTGSTVSGGVCNTSSGIYSVVVGGCKNTASGKNSFIGSATDSTASVLNSTVLNGVSNSVSGKYSTIINGLYNSGTTTNSFIGGGYSGLTLSSYSFIGNGKFNTIAGKAAYGAILGGCGNSVSGVYSGAFGCGLVASVNCTFYSNNFCGCGNIASSNLTNGCTVCVGVGGTLTNGLSYSALTGGTIIVLGAGTCSTVRCGVSNTATQLGSASLAGSANTATNCFSVITGGICNTSSGVYSTVSGGYKNTASGQNSFIGTGTLNCAQGTQSVVLNGQSNTTSPSFGNVAILNGLNNSGFTSSGTILNGQANGVFGILGFSTIGNGCLNNACAGFSTILNGRSNLVSACGSYSSILGGCSNCMCSGLSTISGGYKNVTTSGGTHSFIGGGKFNTVSSCYGSVLGGSGNTVTGSFSSAIGCGLNASANCTLYTNNIITGGFSATTMSSSTITTSFTTGSVIFQGSGGTLSENNSNFFWDNINTGLILGGGSLDSNQILQNNSTKGIRISGTGAGFGYSLVRGSEIAGLATNTTFSLLYSTTQLRFETAANERMRIASTGNVLIGTTTDAGFKLDVNGSTRVQNTVEVIGNGRYKFGAATGLYATTDNGVSSNSGAGNLFLGYYTTSDLAYAGTSVTLGRVPNISLSATSGLQEMVRVTGNFAPTSGTGLFTALQLNNTINQTGGSSGITRGLYVSPTLTSAADFRAIEVERGKVILNSISGNTLIGTTADTGTYKLDVRGLTRFSASTGTSLTVISSGNSTSVPVFSVQGSQGELFSVTDSLTGSLFSVSDISGLPIMEVFSDSTIVLGDYQAPSLYTTKRVSSITATTGTTIYSFPTSAYTSSFVDYYVSGSTGLRAGNIMAIWSGSSVNFTETSTNDLGSTTPVTFGYVMSGSSAVLQASASTGTWIVESILRGL